MRTKDNWTVAQEKIASYVANALKEQNRPLAERVANFIELSPVKYTTFEEATMAMLQATKEHFNPND
jgi:hypothetical protein